MHASIPAAAMRARHGVVSLRAGFRDIGGGAAALQLQNTAQHLCTLVLIVSWHRARHLVDDTLADAAACASSRRCLAGEHVQNMH